MSKTLDELQHDVGIWGDVTFPDSTTTGVLSHLVEEVLELCCLDRTDIRRIVADVRDCMGIGNDDTVDPEEAADVHMLTLRVAHRAGFSLLVATEDKLRVNRLRFWEKTADGYSKHVDYEPELDRWEAEGGRPQGVTDAD